MYESTPICKLYKYASLQGTVESAIARPWYPYRLAASKDKDCDRQPNQYV